MYQVYQDVLSECVWTPGYTYFDSGNGLTLSVPEPQTGVILDKFTDPGPHLNIYTNFYTGKTESL